jgi:hypothetical protein
MHQAELFITSYAYKSLSFSSNISFDTKDTVLDKEPCKKIISCIKESNSSLSYVKLG